MNKSGFAGWLAFMTALAPICLWAQEEDPFPILQTQAETTDPGTTPGAAPSTQTPSPAPQQQPASPFGSDMSASQPFSSGLRQSSSQMYDAPNMFGDLFSPGGQIKYQSTTQLLFLDPAAQATLDPAQLAAIEQQLSNQATQDARQQTLALIDQIFSTEGSIDIETIVIDVALPMDALNDAIVNPTSRLVVVTVQGCVDVQLAGGTRRTKIMENNHTLPQDRVFLLYNHFHNALTTDQFDLPTTDASGITTNFDVRTLRNIQSVNRYTLGFEKTFESGLSSLEFRLPLIGELDSNNGFDVNTQGGNVGNFAVILKRLFYTSENFAVAAGMGLNLPTGSDASGFIGPVNWHVENEAVHYLPFVGVAGTPAPEFFYQAFAQLDIAGSGNEVEIANGGQSNGVGRLNDQTLLYLDASGGAWLYRNPESRLAGLASLLELHYTTTLQDADAFGVVSRASGAGLAGSNTLMMFGNANNHLDILNGTVALHTLLQNGTAIRVGGVFPLNKSDDNRLFDAEVQASVNIPF